MRTALALFLLLPLAACQAPGAQAPAFQIAFAVDTIAAEVAVLDVVNSTQGALVPTGDLRKLTRSWLLDEGFTPLSMQYVDSYSVRQQVAADVRVPGAAVMSMQVLSWKDTHLASRGQLNAQVDFVMYSPDGVVQYRGAGLLEIRLSAGQQASLSPDGRVEAVLEQLVDEVLAGFPQPEPL
ncbi:MAG: hypothetical protein HOM34_00260 [Planctomycetes bacterium]|jgi:hypothetical protein|nr:hypothetical protein [Planctomycetota bacterium]MBT4028202.1 hypothetical protein [Planctomycetota bacterium]MBT4559754.1 hypothetical protein [Planctomycetota bacterium]MBT5101654.1 hypothetical protein [Planctomycetota bacterium]MBT5119136.1 hypothetical protein [Planctomycetota bacterium]